MRKANAPPSSAAARIAGYLPAGHHDYFRVACSGHHKEKGVPVSEAPRLSIEDAINKLFDERRQHALSIASSLLPCPITDTPVLYLHDQIRLCMLFNLNGAAITFCGILVEFALKHATYIKENPGATGFDTSAWGQFEEITLGPAITRAKNAGLIDEGSKRPFFPFEDDLRNKYSHFNIQKITRDVVFERTTEKTWQRERKSKWILLRILQLYKSSLRIG